MTVYNFIPGVKPDIVKIQEKTCRCCKKTLPISDYQKKDSSTDGLQPFCRRCRAVGGPKDAAASTNVKKRLGLVQPPLGTPCDCCGSTEQILWCDHIHGTDIVRGWVCSKCNTGIGHLGDNIDGLLNGIKYLSKNYYDYITVSRKRPEDFNHGGDV